MGLAAAYGLYLGATEIHTDDPTAFWERLEAIGDQFKQTRPDKAHLQWAVDKMLAVAHHSRVDRYSVYPSMCRSIGSGGSS